MSEAINRIDSEGIDKATWLDSAGDSDEKGTLIYDSRYSDDWEGPEWVQAIRYHDGREVEITRYLDDCFQWEKAADS